MKCAEKLKKSRKNIGLAIAAHIDEQNQHNESIVDWRPHAHSRWCHGKCLICGDNFQVLTNYHAEQHGYVNADAMIEAGVIKWRDEFEQSSKKDEKAEATSKQN